MRRQDKPDEPADDPLLFDLPLTGPGELPEEAPPPRRRPARGERGAAPTEPSAAPPPPARAGPIPLPKLAPPEEPSPAAASLAATRGRRLAAGLADLLVHAAVGVAALLGAQALGVRPALAEAPALTLFLAAFSFLYSVLPLAFWGYTPGMAWAGIAARNRDGEPLTFDQTARRWLGGVLTALLLGLPLLLTGSHRSLTDRLSGSRTYADREP